MLRLMNCAANQLRDISLLVHRYLANKVCRYLVNNVVYTHD